MLTIRSSLILAASTWMLVLSIMNRHEPLALFSLAVLIWIWIEWLFFQRVRFGAKQVLIGCTRTIDGHADERVTMVADRQFKIRVFGKLARVTRGYRILVQDTVPDIFEIAAGKPFEIFDSGSSRELVIEYSTTTPICGQVSFPGLQVEISDYCGLFRAEQFVALDQQVTVLPYLIRPQTTVSVLKHNNLQRHIGHHRHKSSGVSSELLGIRDYRVGDPPRTIAWKPTARLGKFMTCEFENEVPIRATLLVDLAAYQFQGRPGSSAADRAITSCAAIAKLLLADRDPVAAILLKSESAQRIDHGFGERQLTRLLQYLLVASNPNPPLVHLFIEDLIKLVFDNCSRRFPHLFNEQYNQGPVRRRPFRFSRKRIDKLRRSLAVVLEHLLKLEPGVSTRLQFDDDAMRSACLNYVEQYSVVAYSSNVTLDPPWLDPARWNSECRRMAYYLCDVLLEAKTRAKDNELFIVIAPEPLDHDCEEAIESAVKSVVSARHRVIFVAPMVPQPKLSISDPVAARILAKTTQYDSRNAETSFRFRMTALGVTFARMDDPALMQIVAMEVGLLQSGKSRGRVMRTRG